MLRPITVLLVLLSAGSAAAEPAPQPAPNRSERARARELAREGMRRLDEGRLSEAHSLFEQASRLVRAPTLAALEGRVLVRLDRLLEARAAYRRAASFELGSDAPPAYRLARDRARETLRDLERRIPRVHVRGPGDRVEIDGRTLALHDGELTLEVDPGDHSLRSPGGRAHSVHVVAYDVAEVDLSSRSSALRTAGWVSVGVGSAGVLAGTLFGVLAINDKERLDDACDANRCPPAEHDRLSRFRTERTLSTLSYAVGLVGIGTGVALLTLTPSEQTPAQKLSISLTPSAATLSGAF